MPLNTFAPDYAVHPGVTLEEALSERSMSQAQLAVRMGRSPKEINEIIRGKVGISADTALELERVLGIPAGFWMRLNANYREFEVRQKAQSNKSEIQEWLGRFNIAELIRRNWIANVQGWEAQSEALLQYFGVASPTQFNTLWNSKCHALRRTNAFAHDHWALIAWLRRGEIIAQRMACKAFDEDRYRGALAKIRGLTCENDPKIFWPEVLRLCADSGVATVIVPELPGIRTSGATHWISPRKAIIQLSLRYKTNDQLWFTFFHESGHILLHGKKNLYVEDGKKSEPIAESQADDFATGTLIPRADWSEFIARGNFSATSVRLFAEELGISPGIVVGQLQHSRQIGWNQLNGFKATYSYSE